MQTRYLYLLRILLPVVDLIMVNASYLFVYYILSTGNNQVNTQWKDSYLVVCNLLWLTIAFLFGLYTESGARRLERIYRATWKTVLVHIILFIFYILFSKDSNFSRLFLMIFYGVLCAMCIINRFLGTLFQYILVKRFKITKSVAIMGNNYTAARLKQYLKRQKNIHFYGFIGSHDGIFVGKDGSLPYATLQQMENAVRNGVKYLYVCIRPDQMINIKELVYEADRQLIRLKFIPDMGGVIPGPYKMEYLGGEFPVITLRNEPMERMSNRFKKRAFDLIFSSLVVIFLLSWLYPIIAIIIKLESKGPILFKQTRSGRNDIPFTCYKFRSMSLNADSHSRQASRNDSRVTKTGRFLRKTSLDELPQFLNVFQGHMSVVGPRPHMLKHTQEYRALIDKFMIRHFSKPGITGWAQVNGLRGETKLTADMERRVEHDIDYVENWTLMWDIKIIFLTIINVVRGEDSAF